MEFLNLVGSSLWSIMPQMLMVQAFLLPFIILEQVLPAGARPRLSDYALNILISLTTIVLSTPIAIAAGIAGAYAREALGTSQAGISLSALGEIPYVGGVVEVLAILAATLFLHDLWFYWAHRLEHKIPVLWEFHKLHHSDERMNCTTWARDHFLQSAWRAIFPAFTLGLVLQLDVQDAGAVGALSSLFIVLLSMFYHSGVRVSLPWLNRILVTPQVHRIHHSTDPAHYNKNFADFLPIFDIAFGTYHAPRRDEFPQTGLADERRPPTNVVTAQLRPVLGGVRALLGGKMSASDAPAPHS